MRCLIIIAVLLVSGCSTVTRDEQLNSLDMNVKNLMTPNYRAAPVIMPMPVIIYQQRQCLNANC